MGRYFTARVRAGTFRIVERASRWQIWFEDEMLGTYASPQAALDDLVGGHTDWPACGDPSSLGLPDEINDWTFVNAAR